MTPESALRDLFTGRFGSRDMGHPDRVRIKGTGRFQLYWECRTYPNPGTYPFTLTSVLRETHTSDVDVPSEEPGATFTIVQEVWFRS